MNEHSTSEESVVAKVVNNTSMHGQVMSKKAIKKRDELRANLLKRGIPENLIEQAMAQEEYKALPIDQKLASLEFSVSHTQRVINDAFRNLAHEMVILRNNQEEIADAFDINLRVIEKVFIKMGVEDSVQKAILAEVTKEFTEIKEKRKAEEALKQQQKKPVEVTDPVEKLAMAEFEAAEKEAAKSNIVLA